MLRNPSDVTSDERFDGVASEHAELIEPTARCVGRRPKLESSAASESDSRPIGRTVAQWTVPVRASSTSSSLMTCEPRRMTDPAGERRGCALGDGA